MKQQLVFLYGLPASGKTTFSNCFVNTHEGFARIGADDVRKELYGSQDSYGDPIKTYEELLRRIKDALSAGQSVLYDAVNMRRDYRLDFLTQLKDFDVEKTIIMLPTSKEVCMDRFLRRKRTITLASVEHYFNMNQRPTYEEGWDNIYTCCSRAYIAAPFFEAHHRENACMAADILRQKGIDTYLPLEHKIKNAWDYKNHEWGQRVFSADIQAINDADTVVMLSYGRMGSAGTAFEAGYAFASGKRVIVVEMPEVELMSLMVANGRHATVRGLDGLSNYDFIRMPEVHDDETEQK